MIFIYILFFVIFIAFSLRYNWWRMPAGNDKARVLMYHSIDEHFGDKFDKWRVKPEDFERQIAWMSKKGYKFFTLSEICEFLDGKEFPKKSVCITFDDGYGDNFTNAYKILKKYSAKASIFLIPNQDENYWEAKNTSHISKMLNKEQILQMRDIVEFGAHTSTHANLTAISIQQAKSEIENSKKDVENITKKPCLSFAYPYGKFNNEIVDLVDEAGFKNAVIVRRGVFDIKDERLKIKRIGILGTEGFFDFWLRFTRIRNKF